MALLGDRIQQKLDLPTELCQTFYSHQAGSGELPGGGGRVFSNTRLGEICQALLRIIPEHPSSLLKPTMETNKEL